MKRTPLEKIPGADCKVSKLEKEKAHRQKKRGNAKKVKCTPLERNTKSRVQSKQVRKGEARWQKEKSDAKKVECTPQRSVHDKKTKAISRSYKSRDEKQNGEVGLIYEVLTKDSCYFCRAQGVNECSS